jgi:hypothetical protein
LADDGAWTEMGQVTHTVNNVSKTYDVFEYVDAYAQLLIDNSIAIVRPEIPG